MSSQAHLDRMKKILTSTEVCEVVNGKFGNDAIQILFRVKSGAEAAWTQVIDRIMTASERIEKEAHSFTPHICKNYFRKVLDDGSRKLVFGWFMSIQSQSMSQALDVISAAVRGSMPESVSSKEETTEVPLWVKELNPPTEKGKGAWTVGGKQDFKIKK